MPRYKAKIFYEVKDGSSRAGDIGSTLTSVTKRPLEIELEADNRHHAERLINAQYPTPDIKLLTEVRDRSPQQSQQRSTTSSTGNSDFDDKLQSVSHSAGRALGEAAKANPSGFLKIVILIGIAIVVLWWLL